MNSVWGNERNRTAVNSVTAELQVTVNTTETGDGFNFLNTGPIGKKVVKAAKQYYWTKNADIFADSTNVCIFFLRSF
jgi:hypothetical protein